jgi:hypothetical protein
MHVLGLGGGTNGVSGCLDPCQFITIDGNSLSTDDLRQLGRGRYKIKVRLGLRLGGHKPCASALSPHNNSRSQVHLHTLGPLLFLLPPQISKEAETLVLKARNLVEQILAENKGRGVK